MIKLAGVAAARPGDSGRQLQIRARAAADAAAQAAGAEIVHAATHADLVAIRELFDAVWSSEPAQPVVTAELLRAYTHTGQYVVTALDTRAPGRPPIAASVGFLGEPIGRALHSHATGVLPPGRGRALGFAVKLHQRAWALDRGLDLVTWTFDPLIRRNAWFNLAKLGARPSDYLVDFYGAMSDGVNVGDESDRLHLFWPLADPDVERACEGHSLALPIAALHDAGAVPLLSVADGEPLLAGSGMGSAPGMASAGPADTALVQVPADIEAVRAADPSLARRWRLALRQVLTGALADGWQIAGTGRDGWYVLRKPSPPTPPPAIPSSPAPAEETG